MKRLTGVLVVLLLTYGLIIGSQRTTAAFAPILPPPTIADVPQLFDIVIDEQHDRLFGSDTASGQLVVVQLSTRTVLTTVSLGQASAPRGLSLSPDGTQLAIALSGFGQIVLLDPATLSVLGRLYPTVSNGPNVPYDVRFGSVGRLYSTGNPSSSGIDYIHTFDTLTQEEIGKSVYPETARAAPRLAIVPYSNILYVAESAFSPQSLSRYSVSANNPTRVSQGPFGAVSLTTVAVRTDGTAVYTSRGQVWSGDLQRQLGAFNASGVNIEYVPATERLFVGQDTTIKEINALLNYDVLVSRPVSGTADVARANAAGTRLYVSTSAGLDVLAVDQPPPPLPTPTATATQTPTNTPIPSATRTPISTPVPTVTPTNPPTATATQVPTNTPVPTLMPTSTPTIIPTPSARPNYTVAVTSNLPNSTGVFGGGNYVAGSTATIAAIPPFGMVFTGWQVDGEAVGWANPLAITVNANRTVHALFANTPAFSDVSPGRPYSQAIAELAARGYLQGYGDGTFGPEDSLVRAQMAALIGRAMNYNDTPRNPFLDQCLADMPSHCVDDELWQRVAQLAARDIARGYSDSATCNGVAPCYAPREFVTQVQIISFITRAMVDQGWWRQQAINPLIYSGILNGTGHEQDVTTFLYYTSVNGGIPDAPPSGQFPSWNKPATRGWFARAFWAGLSSQLGVDRVP